MENLIDQIIAKEWPLFQSVNGEERAFCQNDYDTFVIMRRAQYRAWSREALELYAADLDAAIAAGRSIVREKYIRMMKSTDPAGYEHFSAELPAVSDEKVKLVERIWAHFAAQTERMRNQYPSVALSGRPLYAKNETDGWASVETYQTCELLTYSENTLRALLTYIEALEKDGKDFAYIVQENTVLGLGYPDMETAERTMQNRIAAELGIKTGVACSGNGCSAWGNK